MPTTPPNPPLPRHFIITCTLQPLNGCAWAAESHVKVERQDRILKTKEKRRGNMSNEECGVRNDREKKCVEVENRCQTQWVVVWVKGLCNVFSFFPLHIHVFSPPNRVAGSTEWNRGQKVFYSPNVTLNQIRCLHESLNELLNNEQRWRMCICNIANRVSTIRIEFSLYTNQLIVAYALPSVFGMCSDICCEED